MLHAQNKIYSKYYSVEKVWQKSALSLLMCQFLNNTA